MDIEEICPHTDELEIHTTWIGSFDEKQCLRIEHATRAEQRPVTVYLDISSVHSLQRYIIYHPRRRVRQPNEAESRPLNDGEV